MSNFKASLVVVILIICSVLYIVTQVVHNNTNTSKGNLEKIEQIEVQYEGKIKELDKRTKELEVQVEQLNKKIEKVDGKVTNLASSFLVKEYEVTAFTNGYESTQKRKGDKGYGVMASGERTYFGVLACPKSIPFGTKITIPYFEYKTFTCLDRGSDIVSGRLDVFIKDINKAREFGRRDLKVIIHQ